MVLGIIGIVLSLALLITLAYRDRRGAMAATVVTSALMTYGGISLFVVAFAMFPLARELFRVADIPKRLIPATIALGIFTFTMTALPGTPRIQNIIPGQFFGTSTYAAPGIGLLGTVLIFGMGMVWLEYRRKSLIAAGEHFESEERPRRDGAGARPGSGSGARVGILRRAHGRSGSGGSASAASVDAASRTSGTTTTTVDAGSPDADRGPADEADAAAAVTAQATFTPRNRWVPFLPLLVVFVVNFGLTLVVFPAMNWDYLSEEKYGGIDLDARSGIWAVIVALLAAVVSVVLLHLSRFGELRSSFVEGVKGSMLPISSTASEVGYGAVIASVAAGGLDTLPHSGAVVTLLLVCGMTHRQSYKDLAFVTIVAPVVTVTVLLLLVSAVGSY